MKTDDKDYNKRLEGHAEPLEIEENYAEAKASAEPIAESPNVDSASESVPIAKGNAGGGGIGWAAIGGIAAAFIVCAVYVGSGFRKGPDVPMQITQTETVAFVEPTALTAPEGTTATPASQSAVTPSHDDADAVYLFPLDGSKITDNADLNEIAREAKESGAEVEVTAYTDPSGSSIYNQKLSERRAQAVADYLVAHGVDRTHIHAKGCGPTSDFATAAQDRRAEIHLM